MSFRLYESAWVLLEGSDQPIQVHKDRTNAGAFHVNEFLYDIDARALPSAMVVPRIAQILNLQAVREAGLRGYNFDTPPDGRPGRK